MASTTHRSSGVHFTENNGSNSTSKQETRKKYLTMKYGQHQIKLIQKRLQVESWIDDELMKLFNITDVNETYPCDPDLDEILDMETDEERRNYLKELIKDSKQTDKTKKAFLDEAIQKLNTL